LKVALNTIVQKILVKFNDYQYFVKDFAFSSDNFYVE
jgi:hypothetical protein